MQEHENESNDNITALTVVDADIPVVMARREVVLSEQQLDLLNHTIVKDLNHEEMALFGEVCRRMRLDPFAKQIYAIKRGGRLTFQVGIDGFRSLSERSGKYGGMLGPMWCGEDGVWHDVWLSAKPPVAARVGIIRRDFVEPVWAVARYAAYKVDSNSLWNTMGETMIAKVAEGLARRIAFPDMLSGVYIPEEMEQADNPPAPRVTVMAAVENEQATRTNGNGNGNGKAKPADVNWQPAWRRMAVLGIKSAAGKDKLAARVAKGKTWATLTDADLPAIERALTAIEQYQAAQAAQDASVVDAEPPADDQGPDEPRPAA